MSEFLAYAGRGRTEWWRYLLSLVAACVLAILLLILVTLALTALHLFSPDMAKALQSPGNAPLFFTGIAGIFGVLTAALMASVFLLQKKRPGDVTGPWRWPLFFWGVGICAVLQVVLTGIDFLIAPGGFSLTANRDTVLLALVALGGLGIQTFAEEFIFRGFLTQGLLLAFRKPLPAAIASGLLFGAVHIPNGAPQALSAAVFGIVFALVAIHTGGIALGYGFHLMNNYFGAVLVVSANDVFHGSSGLITQNTPRLQWWDAAVSILALGLVLWFVLKRPVSSLAPRP